MKHVYKVSVYKADTSKPIHHFWISNKVEAEYAYETYKKGSTCSVSMQEVEVPTTVEALVALLEGEREKTLSEAQTLRMK